MKPRPHVVMFVTTGSLFGLAWARAAARIADVTVVEGVERLPGSPVAGTTALAPHPVHDGGFALEWTRGRSLPPRRFTLPVWHRVQARRISDAVRTIARSKGPVDVLHSHFFTMWQVDRTSASLGIPFVHTEHWSGFGAAAHETKRLSGVGRRMAARVFAAAATVMPVSEYLRRSIEECRLPGRFATVPNPVDTSRFELRPLPALSDEIRLVTVGRLAPEKRLDVLLRGLAIASRQRRALALHVVGDGPERVRLEQLARTMGLTSRVRFVGHVPNEQLPAVLASSHLFVTATAGETFGLAIAEAIAAGRPVVAPDAGGVAELVTPATGVLTEGGEPERIADGIVTALKRWSEWDAAAIARVAEERFSDAVVAARLESIYGESREQETAARQNSSMSPSE